ncbi:MAG TPA: hypothetical protein VHJ20_06405 [Polyangia bacterium]|nr:hypothetical protein [Polyangia bacterium]
MFNGKKLTVGKGLLISGGALALVAGVGGIVHAGYKVTPSAWEVSFSGSASSGSFAGALGSARASSDGYQYIGCEAGWFGPASSAVTATFTPTTYGYCYARDRSGNVRSCYLSAHSNDAMTTLSTINQDSYLAVSYFTVSGNVYCSSVWVDNYSHNPVKTN